MGIFRKLRLFEFGLRIDESGLAVLAGLGVQIVLRSARSTKLETKSKTTGFTQIRGRILRGPAAFLSEVLQYLPIIIRVSPKDIFEATVGTGN